MNAIEAGICSFDQSVKQIVENDFEVDFEAKIRLAVSFLGLGIQSFHKRFHKFFTTLRINFNNKL